MNSNLDSSKDAIQRLKAGSKRVVDAVDGHNLSGSAYKAGAGLFRDIVIPTINCVTNAIDDIKTDLNTYKTANSKISGEGYLNEDNLISQIAQKQSMINSINASISQTSSIISSSAMSSELSKAINDLSKMSDDLQKEIGKLKNKLKKLRDFTSETSGLFKNSLNRLELSMKAVTALNKAKVRADGSFSFSSISDEELFKKIQSSSIKTKDRNKEIENTIDNMPNDMDSNQTQQWILDNVEKYGPDFLSFLKKSKKEHKIIDSVLKFKKSEAFLNGEKIYLDSKGRLKYGEKFLTGQSQKKNIPKNSGRFLHNHGKDYKRKVGIDLTGKKYTALANEKNRTKIAMSTFKEAVNPINDFKGWKGTGNFTKVGKGLGIAGTGITIGTNFANNINFSLGVTGQNVADFVTDTAVDFGMGALASSLGSFVGGSIFPGVGNVIGTIAGIYIGKIFNYNFLKPQEVWLIALKIFLNLVLDV